MRNFVLLRASALCLFQLALSAQQPPAPAQDPSHHDAVTSRGDHAMGFSHETTTHHFRLDKTGGAIDVSVFIHDTTPPGAPVMAKLRGQIRYLYADTPSGAKIQISTANPEALQAIHAFLRFQISDHQTGDSSEVQASPL